MGQLASTHWTLRVENLHHYYGTQRTTPSVVFEAEQAFCPSEITVLVGESGSGKSTLLKMLGGLDCPEQGRMQVMWDISADPSKKRKTAIEQDLPHRHDWLAHYRRHRVAYLFQDGGLIDDFSVWQNVLLPLRYAEIAREERDSRCQAALERVGLKDKISKKLRELSGGERHRVAMARTIARQAAIVICDEPTAALDEDNAYLMRDILRDEAARGACVFIATHDHRLMDEDFATRIIKVSHGIAALSSGGAAPAS
ncbi:ATP-binding cassette domain-containing protein [Hyphobacterium sp. HN65]|uniref:ATP-binding cassette domain-containing protein n=1 Tax=Hyphobacterium lacteum TaxID=3116575 RepID=A0ABU7LQD3_9PROT|nr:ATP-binding cassette domain-containing protein [Hyphobacterium sp. HN65]MEE2525804.1 ATP-binding cassette domain-containing protein [Hyphobacterium sp. HN65]